MKVFVIRHGESETNKQGLWTGWLDTPLTEKGRADALLARDLLRGVSFDRVFASDLSRAIDTARIVLPDCEYEATPLLREVNVGNIAGKPLGVIKSDDGRLMNANGYGEFGGESYTEFATRISEFKSRLESLECDRVALFSHAGVMKGFLRSVTGVAQLGEKILCKNCAVAIYEYENGEWSLHSWINLY